MIQSVNKYHIYEVLSADGNFYYTIPKYQREYTWSYREWEALCRFNIQSYKKGKRRFEEKRLSRYSV